MCRFSFSVPVGLTLSSEGRVSHVLVGFCSVQWELNDWVRVRVLLIMVVEIFRVFVIPVAIGRFRSLYE